jgi:hypothetical protein
MRAECTSHLTFSRPGITSCSTDTTAMFLSIAQSTHTAPATPRSRTAYSWQTSTRVEWGKASRVSHYTNCLLLPLLLIVVVVAVYVVVVVVVEQYS